MGRFKLGETALEGYQENDAAIAEFNRLTVENRQIKENARAQINGALEALLALPTRSPGTGTEKAGGRPPSP